MRQFVEQLIEDTRARDEHGEVITSITGRLWSIILSSISFDADGSNRNTIHDRWIDIRLCRNRRDFIWNLRITNDIINNRSVVYHSDNTLLKIRII